MLQAEQKRCSCLLLQKRTVDLHYTSFRYMYSVLLLAVVHYGDVAEIDAESDILS